MRSADLHLCPPRVDWIFAVFLASWRCVFCCRLYASRLASSSAEAWLHVHRMRRPTAPICRHDPRSRLLRKDKTTQSQIEGILFRLCRKGTIKFRVGLHPSDRMKRPIEELQPPNWMTPLPLH